MTLVTERIEKNTLYLELHGRIDSSNAELLMSQITETQQAHPGMGLVLDAQDLAYISSAGLRVVLRLRKAHSELKLVNVSSDVYEILEMTGFTDILPVEKAFRRLSVEGCELIAQGSNGRVYRYDPETIVKVFYSGASLEQIRTETGLCRKVFVKGINTAIPYDVVLVGDLYGSVFELLNAKSISKLIRAEPEKLEQYMQISTDLLKKIHATPIAPGEMPSCKETAVGWAAFLQPHLPEEQWRKLMDMMEAIPEAHYMIHGDYHTNNVMLQDGEPLLIDMDTVSMGHPIFEFASVYLAYQGFGICDHNATMAFLGLPYDMAREMWDTQMRQYFEGDEEKIQDVVRKAKIIGFTRLLRRTIRRGDPKAQETKDLIAACKQQLAELLPQVDRLDY